MRKPACCKTHLIVALNSVDESLISHDLSVSTEECLKAILDGLKLQLADLRDAESILCSKKNKTNPDPKNRN